jgi:hypothetical protein
MRQRPKRGWAGEAAKLIELRFRCSACGSRSVGGVVTGTWTVWMRIEQRRPPLRRDR